MMNNLLQTNKRTNLVIVLSSNPDREFTSSLKDSFLLFNTNVDAAEKKDVMVCLHSTNGAKRTATLRFNLRETPSFLINDNYCEASHRVRYDDDYTQHYIKIELDDSLTLQTESMSFEIKLIDVSRTTSARIAVRAKRETSIIRLNIVDPNDTIHVEVADRLKSI